MRVRDVIAEIHRRGNNTDRGACSLFFLSRDTVLSSLVAAWSQMSAPELDLDRECRVPALHRIKWVWATINPDPIPAWIRSAGLPDAPHVRRACEVAMDNCLVFPDGGISTLAADYFKHAFLGYEKSKKDDE